MLKTNNLLLFFVTSAGALMHKHVFFIEWEVSQCQYQNGLYLF